MVDGCIYWIDHRNLAGKSAILDVPENQGSDRRATPATAHNRETRGAEIRSRPKLDITPPETE